MNFQESLICCSRIFMNRSWTRWWAFMNVHSFLFTNIHELFMDVHEQFMIISPGRANRILVFFGISGLWSIIGLMLLSPSLNPTFPLPLILSIYPSPPPAPAPPLPNPHPACRNMAVRISGKSAQDRDMADRQKPDRARYLPDLFVLNTSIAPVFPAYISREYHHTEWPRQ